MMAALVLFGVSALLELLVYVPGIWRGRAAVAVLASLGAAFAAGMLLVWSVGLWSVLLAILTAYRIINCFRLLENRMHQHYLYRATLRTSVMLIGLQGAVALGWWAWDAWHETGHIVWSLLAAAQLAAATMLCGSTLRRMRRTAWPHSVKQLADSQLPTLTVAIPARNETEDLQACLESLIRSDYPKLEMLVLDDCSQTRRTPEIIRGYAHDGVRFIKGEEPNPTWLPKNQAYAHLAREASGQYILFCGVDMRFEPQALRQTVSLLLAKQKEMLSILPWRITAGGSGFAVIQAMRYFWELAPPRRLFGRPPVLSTCWIISRAVLKQHGGFEAATRSIVPEAHFARQLTKTDGYSFMRASQQVGLHSTKPAREQLATAVRMRYPQLHRRPENVFLTGLAYGGLLLLPFAMVPMGIFWVDTGWPAVAMAAAAALLLIVTYERILAATRTAGRWLGFIVFPFGIVYDLYLIHYSMWQYEFSVVEWKGRNICIPAMHVVPHLPKF